MASAVRQITGVGGDIRKIARLLQKEAPPGHMLAYINQEEADLLKARGGSGEPHADTGVPSFAYEESEFYTTEAVPTPEAKPASEGYVSPYQGQYGSSPDLSSMPSVIGDVQAENVQAPFVNTIDYFPYFATPPVDVAVSPVFAEGATRFTAAGAPTEGYERGAYLPAAQPTLEPGFFEGLSSQTKARLGIGGLQSVLGAYQISQATEQAKKYREDMAKLAQPYQAEGKKLIAQAQSGQLTPAAQQQLQAAQAQAAQGAERRGGVGAQQAMMAVENMRQQLLQNQYDYGLKVSGIGDQIASGAIRAGMQADKYVNSLASSYANNIARLLAGTPTYVNPYAQPVA